MRDQPIISPILDHGSEEFPGQGGNTHRCGAPTSHAQRTTGDRRASKASRYAAEHEKKAQAHANDAKRQHPTRQYRREQRRRCRTEGEGGRRSHGRLKWASLHRLMDP